jgi:RNA polymerase sigma-70 factor (ECF subfamily)
MEDEALVQQVKKNLQGQTAFAELYRRHVDRVYRYLLARVGNVDDAQDLTAQTFLAALEALPRYRGQAKFTTWLLGIARHKAADHFRQQRPMVSLDETTELQHPTPLPDEAIDQTLRLEAIIQTMRALSSDRAEALALHSFGGLPVPQVAEIMDKSEAAVRMLIHRAIQDLKQRLSVQTQEGVA